MGGAYYMGVEEKDYRFLTWEEKALSFAVREPFPSVNSQTDILMGILSGEEKLVLRSNMPEKGVFF